MADTFIVHYYSCWQKC